MRRLISAQPMYKKSAGGFSRRTCCSRFTFWEQKFHGRKQHPKQLPPIRGYRKMKRAIWLIIVFLSSMLMVAAPTDAPSSALIDPQNAPKANSQEEQLYA